MDGLGLPGADPQEFLQRLVESVGTILPAGAASALTVDRSRSLGDRVRGRSGAITAIRLTTVSQVLTLRLEAEQWVPESARVSGGVIIARKTLSLGDWLNDFAGRIASIAADAAGDAATAARALEMLGVQSAGSDIEVRDDRIAADLAALAPRLHGRVSDEAIKGVGRIAELLSDTLPRVADDPAADRIVRRTATSYLPDTIRVFLSLPTEWVAGHVFRDGTTPEEAFVTQLSVIEEAAVKLRDSAINEDGAALEANGRFLAARFGRSVLDLP